MFGPRTTPAAPTRSRLRVVPRLDALDARDVPAVIAVPDFYTVRAGQTLTVPVATGVLSNDFSDSNAGAIIVADLKAGPTLSGPPAPALPANALTLNANGSFTFTAPSNLNPANNPITFVYQARDTTNGEVAQTTVTINVTGAATALYAVGSGRGQPSEVKVFDGATGLQKFVLNPYSTSFTGGVRVATGDINQDGVDDIVTVPDIGGSAHVIVFDGKTGSSIGSFFAFEDTFRGGAHVAIGDIDQDLVKDIIVGAGDGGGPRVQVYSLIAGGQIVLGLPPVADFFAYEGSFRGGVRVAAGDLDGDSFDEIVAGAGPGGGPSVKVFGAAEVFAGFADTPAQQAYFAFDPGNRGGVNVAVGQFRGDGRGDIVTGTGNGSALVRVFDGRSGAALRSLTVSQDENPVGGTASGGGLQFGGLGGNLLGGVGTPNGLAAGAAPATLTGGARVAVIDRDGDGLSDIVVGQGIGQAPRVRIFGGNSLVELSNTLVFGSLFNGGVYVGGNSLELG
jgi:hypothetical protein